MRLGLLLLFTAVPFLEIALMIKVGQSIGFWPTLGLIVASATLGTYVLYEQGFQVLARATEAMGRGRAPVAPVIDGLFILLSGLLLIVPGFLTDIAGLTLLIPRVRHRVATWSIRTVLRSAEMRGFVFRAGQRPGASSPGARPQDGARRPGPPPPPGEGQIIEGEVLHVGERTVDPTRGPPPPPQGRT
jgi:UPF0716 protein FxsA